MWGAAKSASLAIIQFTGKGFEGQWRLGGSDNSRFLLSQVSRSRPGAPGGRGRPITGPGLDTRVTPHFGTETPAGIQQGTCLIKFNDWRN